MIQFEQARDAAGITDTAAAFMVKAEVGNLGVVPALADQDTSVNGIAELVD